MILLDTNVLTRITSAKHPHCGIIRRAIAALRARKEQLAIVPQNFYEFWAVATRKEGAPPTGQNGLGMTTAQASQWLWYFQRQFTLLPEREDLLPRWHELVTRNDIKGLRSHDARLAAAMTSYGITHLLTFNVGDFRVYPITVLDPNAL